MGPKLITLTKDQKDKLPKWTDGGFKITTWQDLTKDADASRVLDGTNFDIHDMVIIQPAWLLDLGGGTVVIPESPDGKSVDKNPIVGLGYHSYPLFNGRAIPYRRAAIWNKNKANWQGLVIYCWFEEVRVIHDPHNGM